MKRVSIRDIAAMVGVSPSTVSFVLNGKATEMRISQEVADKIREAARRSGYTPNPVAVSLRTGRSKMLGLMVEDISNVFFATLAKVIEEEAERYGYKVLYCSTENSSRKGHELIRMLSHQQVDGYLITPAPGMEKDIQSLLELYRPVVLMDRYFPAIDVPYVMANNRLGVLDAMEHLVQKGLRKIGFVTVDIEMVQLKERRQAYSEALRKHKIPVRKDLVLTLPYQQPREEGITALRAFTEAHPDLEALFFATNYLGILGLELGPLPQGMAMLCFDDHDIFRLYPGGITCVQQPVREIGRTAVELLMAQLGGQKGDSLQNKVQLPVSLIVRGSA